MDIDTATMALESLSLEGPEAMEVDDQTLEVPIMMEIDDDDTSINGASIDDDLVETDRDGDVIMPYLEPEPASSVVDLPRTWEQRLTKVAPVDEGVATTTEIEIVTPTRSALPGLQLNDQLQLSGQKCKSVKVTTVEYSLV